MLSPQGAWREEGGGHLRDGGGGGARGGRGVADAPRAGL